MREPSNQQVTLVAMLLTTLMAITAMLCISADASAQSGQPWDSSFDKPAKLNHMVVDTNLTNLQTCRVARSLKRKGTLTRKGKREACEANRKDNSNAFWAAFFVGMATPRYYYNPYYMYRTPNVIILNN